MLTIKLEESDCFCCWVMGGNTFLDTAAHDIKGKEVTSPMLLQPKLQSQGEESG